jgi:hypothetical protein
MPYKDPIVRKAKAKENSAKHYEQNKKAIKEATKQNRRQKKDEWLEFKKGLDCTHCGFSHPAVIDFHHIGAKKYNVNELIKNGRFGLAYKEIKQCITLCANCHRIHHYSENLNGKKPPGFTPGVTQSPRSVSDGTND